MPNSLLDFINFLPLQATRVARSPINEKEAKTLFELWKNKQSDNSILVPETTDPSVVASLIVKGFVVNRPVSSLHASAKSVEMSKKGKDVIKNIILHTERSSFENKTASDFSYESIHNRIYGPAKTASALMSIHTNPRNWLERCDGNSIKI